MRRVLKPGGEVLIACTMYKGGKYDKRNRRFVDEIDMSYLSVDELQELLADADFDQIRVIVDYDKGWICATARKET